VAVGWEAEVGSGQSSRVDDESPGRDPGSKAWLELLIKLHSVKNVAKLAQTNTKINSQAKGDRLFELKIFKIRLDDIAPLTT
jgi:hypothetical protein